MQAENNLIYNVIRFVCLFISVIKDWLWCIVRNCKHFLHYKMLYTILLWYKKGTSMNENQYTTTNSMSAMFCLPFCYTHQMHDTASWKGHIVQRNSFCLLTLFYNIRLVFIHYLDCQGFPPLDIARKCLPLSRHVLYCKQSIVSFTLSCIGKVLTERMMTTDDVF